MSVQARLRPTLAVRDWSAAEFRAQIVRQQKRFASPFSVIGACCPPVFDALALTHFHLAR
jgi:hypothetical protein